MGNHRGASFDSHSVNKFEIFPKSNKSISRTDHTYNNSLFNIPDTSITVDSKLSMIDDEDKTPSDDRRSRT
jgi:hypothetical protein